MANIVLELPTLYKKASTGKTQQWRIWVEEEENSEQALGVIMIEQGQTDGKKQTYREEIRVGKNLGKSNETTALEQAKLEAQAKWTKQKDRKHYGLTVEESAAKRDVAPMLAHTYQDERDKVVWEGAIVQPKLNGHRCLAFKDETGVRLISRQGKPIETLPHIVEELQRFMEEGDTWDGELYVHGVKLNTVGSWIKKKQPDSAKVEYHVYDNVLDRPFRDRMLVSWMDQADEGCVKSVPTHDAVDEKRLYALRDLFIANGYEGAILRHGPKPYESGKRSDSLLKVKKWHDGEFKIVGVQEGTGTHKGMAVFTCVTPEGHEFGVISPGTHEEKREFWNNRDSYIGKMLTIEYAEMTSTDKPVPFHPKALQIREDV